MKSDYIVNKDKFTISIISHSAIKGGAERAMLEMIDVLLKNDVFVHVVLPESGPLEQELKDRNIIYDKVEMQWWVKTDTDSTQSVEEKIKNDAVTLASIISKVNPDIIYTITSVISEGAVAAKILGIPHIWNISEFGRKEHGIEYLLEEKERMDFINQYSDKIFFVSEAIKNYYTDKIDISDKSYVFAPITNINIGKDENDYRKYYQEDVFKVSIVGNLVEGKGHLDAVMAIGELVKQNIEVQLVMAGNIGDEEYYEKIKKVIKDNKIEKNINFIGCIDGINSLMKQSDIVLVCSVFEGFGRVAVEAMLNKKPVVGADSGATPELIDDERSGFLYKSGNFKELAEKINFFINNPDKIKEFGGNGYNFVKEKFDKEIYEKRLLDEFHSLNGKKTVASKDILNNLFDAIIYNNEKIQNLKEEINQREKHLSNIVNSLRWKIPNYFYKKYKNISKK